MHYFHHVPGRLRVKIPELKGEPAEAERVAAMLLAVEGIGSAAVAPLTGSLLVRYDPEKIAYTRILSLLQQAGLIDAARMASDDAQLEAVMRHVGRAILGWAVGRALNASGLSAVAAML